MRTMWSSVHSQLQARFVSCESTVACRYIHFQVNQLGIHHLPMPDWSQRNHIWQSCIYLNLLHQNRAMSTAVQCHQRGLCTAPVGRHDPPATIIMLQVTTWYDSIQLSQDQCLLNILTSGISYMGPKQTENCRSCPS